MREANDTFVLYVGKEATSRFVLLIIINYIINNYLNLFRSKPSQPILASLEFILIS